jgi:hypothetical protein
MASSEFSVASFRPGGRPVASKNFKPQNGAATEILDLSTDFSINRFGFWGSLQSCVERWPMERAFQSEELTTYVV